MSLNARDRLLGLTRTIREDKGLRANLMAYGRYLLAHPAQLLQPRPSFAYQEPPYLRDVRRPAGARLANAGPRRLPWGGRDAAPPARLALASDGLDVSDHVHLDWGTHFADWEDEAALHRFAWLLPWMVACSQGGASAESVSAIVSEMTASWARTHTAPGVGAVAWQPYTVSERLVNWIWAALACGVPFPEPRSMREQASYVRQHLEYYGDRLTGNHLSNNGRALYLAGLALGDDSLIEDGQMILLRERARLFDADGFLREDSTHYQFLVTRNYCEALWMARQASDDTMVAKLRPTVASLTRACGTFLVRRGGGAWDLPLIGDISPDCTPEWLIGVPWIGAALTDTIAFDDPPTSCGWHSLFSDVRPELGSPPSLAHGSPAWARIELGDWTCVSHANPEGIPRQPGHPHNDTGGIVVYHRGELVVMDAGRRHYKEDAEGRYGRGPWAHSLVVVDGLESAPEWRWFLAPGFLKERTGMKPRLVTGADHLTIEHGAGSMAPGVGLRRRRVSLLEGGELQVLDEVEGTGRHEISVVFHLPHGARWSGPDLRIPLSGRELRLRLDPSLPNRSLWQAPADDATFGWAARSYGQRQAITTIVASGRVSLPWRGTSQIAVD